EENKWKRSGQIPPFGNWEYTNDLPITQYFESARQAGLTVRYTNSSGECGGGGDLYATTLNFQKPRPPKTIRGGDKKWNPDVKEQKKQAVKTKKNVGIYQYQYQRDVTEAPRKQNISKHIINTNTTSVKIVKAHGGGGGQRRQQQPPKATAVKAVDEDLYKIPPHLLKSSNRKKRLGFFSRCLMPACIV
ncbi:RPM1-interacting protein, partial [Actinidia chinensis var. chinensis]